MSDSEEVEAKVQLHPIYKTPQRMFDIKTKPSAGDPKDIAESFLKMMAPRLKINQNLSQLKFDKVNKSMLGSHALFQQYHRDLQISGAWVKVDIDNGGKVVSMLSDLVPESNLKEAERREHESEAIHASRITVSDAEKAVLAEIAMETAGSGSVLDSELVYYPYRGIPVRTWKLIMKTYNPLGEWKAYVDVYSGAVLFLHNQLKMQDGRARVFNPNPVVTLRDTSLTGTSKISKSAYLDVILPGLDGSGWLNGPYVNTKLSHKRVRKKNLKFHFGRSNRAFKEVMVYYHIDKLQRYIQELGFNNVINHSIRVDIAGTKEDNSFYSPKEKTITFGTGGVDDAEDAEIIIHEYGHAIQDDQVPGFGVGEETRAMGEGFGDYLAASFFEKFKTRILKHALASWDAVAYSGDEPPCLRRLDSNKKYPKDITHEEHNDGEIWSACMWQIRSSLGRRAADKLIIAHHFLLSRTSNFEDAANALLQTDKMMNKGRNRRLLRNIFVRWGIFPNSQRNNARAGEPFFDSIVNARGK